MKRFLLVILVGALVGCKNFETRKLSSDQIVEEEMEGMDFKALDTYPSFENCDDETSKTARKKCFERELSHHMYRVLGKHEVVLKDSIHEKIQLTITISAEGKPDLEKISISDELEKQIPEIEKWLEEGIADLPKIYPAKKRGVPVSSKFKLPLIIASD